MENTMTAETYTKRQESKMMGRPPIHGTAMTAAERQRRRRARTGEYLPKPCPFRGPGPAVDEAIKLGAVDKLWDKYLCEAHEALWVLHEIAGRIPADRYVAPDGTVDPQGRPTSKAAVLAALETAAGILNAPHFVTPPFRR